jgi:dCMP deaminase
MEDKRIRPDLITTFFDNAKVWAKRCSCSRRQLGTVLVKSDRVIATGYVGTCRGSTNCGLEIPCLKDLYGEAPLASYKYCSSIHAEENVILNAARNGVAVEGATMFMESLEPHQNGRPCPKCQVRMINAGIKDIYYKLNGEIVHENVKDWVNLENKRMADFLKDAPKNQPMKTMTERVIEIIDANNKNSKTKTNSKKDKIDINFNDIDVSRELRKRVLPIVREDCQVIS